MLGSYEINIVANDFDAMLSANDIIAPVPSFDLLDGQDYTFRLQYQDRGGNPSAGVEATMIRFDVTQPRFTAAELNLSTGTLIVTATEILNLDENDRGTYYSVNQTVNLGQFFVGNESATADLLSLSDGTFIEADGTAITIIMEENDRISAIEQSATPGGDGTPLVVDVLSNAVFDLATNPSLASLDVAVTEFADVVDPFVLGASLDYDSGVITLNVSERIDVTPASGIDVSKLFLSNSSGANNIQLSAADLQTSTDDTIISIKISEQSRALAIAISGTPGGDTEAAFLDVSAMFMHDIGLVDNRIQNGIVLLESPDVTPPSFISGSISYDDSINGGGRKIVLTMSETIDLTPLSLVNTSCFVLSEDGSNTPIVVLHGATALGSDGTSLTIQMSEAHRVAAVLASGTPGGDGSGVKLNILQGGVRDISTLENLVQANLTLTEVADVRSHN